MLRHCSVSRRLLWLTTPPLHFTSAIKIQPSAASSHLKSQYPNWTSEAPVTSRFMAMRDDSSGLTERAWPQHNRRAQGSSIRMSGSTLASETENKHVGQEKR